ncbi:MAG: hypothetical protein U1E36_07850 [Rickettsiales bacterium]
MKKNIRLSGFSLTELAFIIAIIGVVAGVTVSTGKVQLDYASASSTNAKLELVRDALLTFKKKARRLPCPAVGSDAPSSATYGVEASSCDPSSCPAGLICSNNVVTGVVPFATLGINGEEAVDSWDDKITYAVDYSHVTNTGNGLGRIRVNDIAGNKLTSSPIFGEAIFVLISSGKDGNGAWRKVGGAQKTCGSTAKDTENCNGDSVFVSSSINESDVAANYYDDIILWHSQDGQTDDQAVRIDKIATERYYSCMILSNGRLYCIGKNDVGQLGAGDTVDKKTYTEVSGGFSDWKAITLNNSNSCGIRGTNNEVYCWGHNDFGQLGDGTSTNRSIPTPVKPESGSNTGWTVIDTEDEHTCGIREGHLLCWGSDANGRLGDDNAVSAGTSRPREVIGGYDDWIDVDLGSNAVCGIRNQSGVYNAYCWGENIVGKSGDGTTTTHYTPTLVSGGITDWRQIDSNGDTVCALRANGQLYCWGEGSSGQIGKNSATDSSTPTLVKDSTGTGSWNDWTDITTAHDATCGIRASTLYCWGSEYGTELLGNGAVTGNKLVPYPVSTTFNDWVSVKMGHMNVCALRGNGNMYCWGDNSSMQIGNLSTTNPVNAPTLVTAY